jgi:catalase
MTDTYEAPLSTTEAGAPAPSDAHSLTVGPDGPMLLHDYEFVKPDGPLQP